MERTGTPKKNAGKKRRKETPEKDSQRSQELAQLDILADSLLSTNQKKHNNKQQTTNGINY